MDAVTSGLVAGASASSLLLFAGVVAYASDAWRRFMTPEFVFAWFVVLSALTIGQLGTTGIILQKLSAAPSQAKGAVAA
jgi:hypothetical protein